MGRGERKVECTSMQGRKNGGERGKNGKKQALKSNGPWVLATPKVYLAQFGSSMIIEQTSQQKHPRPAHPMEKYTSNIYVII